MKTLNKILETVLGLLVAVMVLGCIWQVITRFVLNNPSKYTEELLRYLLIWTTMLGVPYAYGKDKHLSINIAVKYFSPKGKAMTNIFIEALILVLSVFVMVAGGWMVTMNSAGQISPAMHMPMQLYYAGVPVSGVLMVCYGIERLRNSLKQWKEEKMKGINQEELEKKLDLVIQKLMNLGGPEDEKELEAGGEKIGFFRRDFGIKEWDWPQGVGLYGLLKIMKVKNNQEYRDFLYHWFEDNIREGLPSKNINTTTPLLALAEALGM